MKKEPEMDIIRLYEDLISNTQQKYNYVSAVNEQILRCLKQLEPMDLKAFSALFTLHRFKRNDVLQAPQKPIKQVWLIENGIAQSYIEQDQKHPIVCFHFPGELIGHYACALLQQRCELGIQSYGKMRCWAVDISELNIFQKLFPNISPILNWLIIGKIEWFQRMACCKLRHSALEHYKYLMKHHPSYFEQISLKHIASYMQISVSSLSRIRAEISKGGKKGPFSSQMS